MKKELTQKKAKWINQRSKLFGGFISKSLTSKNKSVEMYYRKALENEVSKFIDFALSKIEEEYKPFNTGTKTIKSQNSLSSLTRLFLLLKGKYSLVFLSNIDKIVDKFFNKSFKSSTESIKENIEILYGKPLAINYSKELDNILKASITENVSLIKNVSSQVLTNIEVLVYNAMTKGRGWQDIQEDLQGQKEIADKRVKKIARDQTSKTNASINKEAQQSLGIEYFEWDGANDERERPEHKKLNSKIYKWDDNYDKLPIIDKEGKRGYPSDAVNCRCTAKSIILMDGYKTIWDNSSKSYVIKKE